MKQRPYWQLNSHSATQETSRLYGTRRFITVFKRASHWSLSSATFI